MSPHAVSALNAHPEPLAGRVILLVAAYCPIFLIVAVRAYPHWSAYVLAGVFVAGLVGAATFFAVIRTQTNDDFLVREVEPLDRDVAAYVASYLLPLVATNKPTTQDLIAYGICAAMFAAVALQARLWAISPIFYLVRRRLVMVQVGARRMTLLTKAEVRVGNTVIGREALGVVLVGDVYRPPESVQTLN